MHKSLRIFTQVIETLYFFEIYLNVDTEQVYWARKNMAT